MMLSRLEWQVVSLAMREAGECGCHDVIAPSPIGRAFRRTIALITGGPERKPLADPRLEALRRFVCLSRWGNRAAEEVAGRLIELGFSDRQVRAVQMLAGR